MRKYRQTHEYSTHVRCSRMEFDHTVGTLICLQENAKKKSTRKQRTELFVAYFSHYRRIVNRQFGDSLAKFVEIPRIQRI